MYDRTACMSRARRALMGSDGVVTVIVRSSEGDQTRRALAEQVVGNGWGLLELRPLAMTLEDLFVRLVRSERDASV